MQPRWRQRALVFHSLLVCAWAAMNSAAAAQLLVDDADEEVVHQAQRIRRVSHESVSAPEQISVPADEPEEILETQGYETVYENEYGDCDACGEGGYSDRPFRAGPLGWLHAHVQEMQIQQETTSWLNRPASLGVFVGQLWPDDPIAGRVKRSDGLIGGYNLGSDFSLNWGWEVRLALASPEVYYEHSHARRSDDIILADLNFHYYPWDNARWRPYASFGVGVAQFDFGDEFDRRVHKSTFEVPLGVGMKYLIHRTSAFRLELMNNIAFSNGPLDTQHNVSLTAGLEFRFGGVRRSYWPWNPGREYGY